MTASKRGTERQSSTGRYVAGSVALVVLLALVAPFVVYGVPQVVGADASFVVLSGSMEPSIETGDAVIVESVRPAQIRAGDVITFTRDGASAPITHRVVEVTDEGGQLAFVTKGDNNEEADARPVPAANVVGRVALTIPYLGLVVDFANTEPGYLLLVVVPVALLVLNEAYTFLRGGSGAAAERADASDADEKGATRADETDASDGAAATIQVTRADLTYTLGALGLLAAYAAYVAVVVDTSALSVTVVVAAVGVFALTAAIRHGAPPAPAAPATAGAGPDDWRDLLRADPAESDGEDGEPLAADGGRTDGERTDGTPATATDEEDDDGN